MVWLGSVWNVTYHVGYAWCGVVWCGVVWCGVVWCGVMRDAWRNRISTEPVEILVFDQCG